jgi:hypothetical protein
MTQQLLTVRQLAKAEDEDPAAISNAYKDYNGFIKGREEVQLLKKERRKLKNTHLRAYGIILNATGVGTSKSKRKSQTERKNLETVAIHSQNPFMKYGDNMYKNLNIDKSTWEMIKQFSYNMDY